MLLLLLLFSILVNTVTSSKVATAFTKRRQLLWALLGVAVNLGILSFFKYGGLLTKLGISMFGISLNNDSDILNVLLHIPLPIGISFYTFQGISLVNDVLHNEGLLGRHISQLRNQSYLVQTSFFISFFPQLVAGPIVQAKDFYPQIERKYFQDIPWENVVNKLVMGYFLKMVIADNLKDFTFWIAFPYYQNLGTTTNLVLLFGYSMQIFADFAGYSLIAIGLGAAFGYRLPENFNFPYVSRSISEFWRRWHISLSSWLRKYLYIPLGGNRKGELRTYLNLMIVMTLGGLWHGAAWSYAVWGIFHGFGLALERFLGIARRTSDTDKVKPLGQQFFLDALRSVTVFAFVSVGWLLFKLPNFNEAIDFLRSLRNVGIPPRWSYVVPVLIFSLPVILYHLPHFPTFQNRNERLKTHSPPANLLKKFALGVMLALILLNSGSANEFIYFQF